MRCQRCGFEIEPGQTFCSMCGTEQSKAMRKSKKKIKSILGVIKVASVNHAKMWGNFALTVAVMLYVIFAFKGEPVQVSYICLTVLMFLYVTFQCLLPYKNPNASKSKKYKLGMRISFVLIILFAVLVLITGELRLMDLARGL